MNFICKTCKSNFKVEYKIDNIIEYNECQSCILEREENTQKIKGCHRCNKLNDNKRLCDDCVEKSGLVKCERIIAGIVLFPFIPILLIPFGYCVMRNKCLGRHWSEHIIN